MGPYNLSLLATLRLITGLIQNFFCLSNLYLIFLARRNFFIISRNYILGPSVNFHLYRYFLFSDNR
ncbi:Uncharacterised protein [Streptococcus suis]|nr:Uncharacterised protein [Streptococcus suis]